MALTPAQLRRLRRTHAPNRLRAARHMLELTQVELAAAVGVTQSALSDLERQRYGGTTVDTARKFSAYFGCQIEDLFPVHVEEAVS